MKLIWYEVDLGQWISYLLQLQIDPIILDGHDFWHIYFKNKKMTKIYLFELHGPIILYLNSRVHSLATCCKEVLYNMYGTFLSVINVLVFTGPIFTHKSQDKSTSLPHFNALWKMHHKIKNIWDHLKVMHVFCYILSYYQWQ